MQHYFDGECNKAIRDSDASLDFRLSRRMTSCGGTTTMEMAGKNDGEVKQFEIAVATTLFVRHFSYQEVSESRWL